MTLRHDSVAFLIAARLVFGRAALPQEVPAGPYPINGPRLVVLLSEPPGARIVKNGSVPLGSTPLTTTLTRSGRNGYAAPVMLEALPSDSTQCPQARVFDNRQLTPDTVEFFMLVCPSDPVRPDSVYRSEDVTDPPMRVSSPPVRYPDVLRQQRIGGRVVVQFVVDTSGRAEPGSLRVLECSDALFGPPALEIARASIFLPGHHQGRRIRVRVQMPVDFGMWRGQD
jgi:TonB family protein